MPFRPHRALARPRTDQHDSDAGMRQRRDAVPGTARMRNLLPAHLLCLPMSFRTHRALARPRTDQHDSTGCGGMRCLAQHECVTSCQRICYACPCHFGRTEPLPGRGPTSTTPPPTRSRFRMRRMRRMRMRRMRCPDAMRMRCLAQHEYITYCPNRCYACPCHFGRTEPLPGRGPTSTTRMRGCGSGGMRCLAQHECVTSCQRICYACPCHFGRTEPLPGRGPTSTTPPPTRSRFRSTFGRVRPKRRSIRLTNRARPAK